MAPGAGLALHDLQHLGARCGQIDLHVPPPEHFGNDMQRGRIVVRNHDAQPPDCIRGFGPGGRALWSTPSRTSKVN